VARLQRGVLAAAALAVVLIACRAVQRRRGIK
jgi:hypothetical protein